MAQNPKKYRLANSVFFFISGFGYSSWASRIPTVKQQLHLSDAQLGVLLFALPVGLMITMPFTGRLLNKFSSRYIMLIGAICYAIVLCLPGLTAFSWQLAIILLFFGASRNLLNLSSNAQALGVQRLYNRSIMTTFHAVWSVAGFTGAAVGYLMVYFNVVPVAHLLGAAIFLLTLTAWFYPSTLQDEPAKDKKPFFVLPDKVLLKFSLICFVSMACENTMYDWSGLYFQSQLHATKSVATAAFVVFMAAVTTGRLFGDYFVLKVGIKRILFVSGVFICIGFLSCFFMQNIYLSFFSYFLIGIGVSCVVPLVFSLAGKSKSLSGGSALASISTIGYLGFLMVPPLIGFISQSTSMKWAFLVMACLGTGMIYLVSLIEQEEQESA
ncbi:Fucose permease [Mucilaginibacter pineti]|uniref:Fucose permease n=1 Tax=Mucilaginibacter pineti TaxID=1391627 RepID=A0A1G7JJ34_9SPHI|nr:MFS transporter [Mucilaginibacter pineti]SDF24903.1 Fucose permease [Mucilaginibacter pineti]